MLEKALHIGTFGAFLVVAGFIGFFLWQSLFVEKVDNDSNRPAAPQTEQQRADEKLNRGGAIPGNRDATDKALANYTKWLAVFTAFLVLATIGLFVSGERSVDVARRSADAAKGSANAANKSAEIAERALIAGQRAFVSVAFNQNANRDIKTGDITRWQFVPVWLNTGNTPTRNMENHVSIMWPDKEFANEWDFPDYWSSGSARDPAPLSASPKSTVQGEALFVPVDIIADIINGKRFLYFWGWAAYNDVFPDTPRYVTRFAVRIVIGGDARDKDKISFNYRYLARYNCSDEECERQGFPASWQARQAEPQ
jgi:hypothetical protein